MLTESRATLSLDSIDYSPRINYIVGFYLSNPAKSARLFELLISRYYKTFIYLKITGRFKMINNEETTNDTQIYRGN